MSIDLHCHTILSDGATSIEELLALAITKEIKVISITDHNTFAGCTRAVITGKRLGINIVPGTEISCYDYTRNKEVHLLCYYPTNPNRLEGILKKISDEQKRAMMISAQKVARIYQIPMDMFIKRAQASGGIFKQHIMQAVMDAGYAETMFGNEYKKLFGDRIGLANTKAELPSVYDVIEEIRAASGAIVLAHPAQSKSMDLALELCDKKLINGLECETPGTCGEDKLAIKEMAKKYGLCFTGGSNFHGANSSNCCPVGSFTTEQSQFNILKKAKKA